MRKLNYLLLLVLFSTSLYSQSKLFYKSHGIYKYKNYITVNLSDFFNSSIKSFPYIEFKKRPIKLGNDYAYEIKFGYKGVRSEYISLSNDTIYYFDLGRIKQIKSHSELLSVEKKPLFILNQNFQDSIYVMKFGELEYHYIKLDNLCYYNSINDTAYIFSLRFQYPDVNPVEVSSKDRYYFNKIIISKKFGFLELSFKRLHTWMEIRYY